MGMRAVTEITKGLPCAIAEDVLGYARSVQSALPEIFREAEIARDRELGERLVFIAGLKKIESLVISQFWTLDNSLHLLRQSDITSIRIGSMEISQGSGYHRRLQEAVRDLEKTLVNAGVAELVQIRSYSELARRLQRGRRRDSQSD